MEISFFAFVALVILYFLFREPVKSSVKATNEGLSKVLLELKDPDEITRLKKKFGCTDTNVKTMSQLLQWIDEQ